MPLKLCPSCRSRKKLQNGGIETSVRPNPTIVFSNLRSRFAAKTKKTLVRTGGSLIVRAGAREANRQDGRELNRQGGCAGGDSSGRAGA